MEHLREGRITFMEFSLFNALLMEANPSTGLVYGSAGLFATMYGLPPRTVRFNLEKLEEKGYIKRFATQGKHGSYPLLIDKFECTDGAMKGSRVNAKATTVCSAIVYESCHEDVDENVNDVAVTLPQVKRIENREKKKEARIAPELPPYVSPETYAAWREMRCKIRNAPFTELVEKRIVSDLCKLKEYGIDPNSRLEEAIRRGWRGILFDDDKPAARPTLLSGMRFANGGAA